MANSVMLDWQGPDWPLGNIVVVTPGTPVRITSLVDPNNYNAPETALQPSTGSNIQTGGQQEYTALAQQIMFQAVKAGASHGLQNNAGNIYIVRYGSRTVGSGNRDDLGVIVCALAPGQTFFLASAPRNRDTFSPYRYYIDADNSNDGCQVTLIIQ